MTEAPVADPRPRAAAPRAALLLALAFVVAQAVLLIPPAASVPEGLVDLGFPHIPTDHAQYQAYAVQTRDEGRWLTRNPYTTEPQDGRFLLVGLAASGVLARVLPDAIAWHALRLAGAALLAWALWGLCARLFPAPRRALTAFAAVLFTGGLQWAARAGVAAGAWPDPGVNSWLQNPWNFSVFWTGAIAQWVLPLAVLLAALRLDLDPDPPGVRASARGGLRALAFVALWSLHPYTAMAYGVLLAVFLAVPLPGLPPWRARVRTAAWGLAPVLAGVTLVLAYVAWASEDPVYAASTAQTRLWKLAYPPWLFPIVYGPQVLLALAGLGRDRPGERGFGRVQAWLAVALLLAVNPVVTAGKFQYLAGVPLVLLEVRGLFRLWDRRAASRAGAPARDRRAIAFLAAGLALASLDSVAGLVSDFRDAPTRAASVSDPATLAALDALRDLPGGGVLCEPGIGLLVPWKAGKPVFVGHWFLSTRYAEKADVVRWFLTGPFGPEPRAEVLRQARVRWVLRGPEHTRAGPPPEVPGLGTRWSGGGWEILEFTDPAPGDPG